MTISERTCDTITVFPFSFPMEDLFFLDIETTGLKPEASSLYLIGCLYYKEDRFHILQWFADDFNGEEELLSSFLAFLSDCAFKKAVAFFGERFTFPYLSEKCAAHGLAGLPASLERLELYSLLLPFQELFKLDNLKFKTLEQLLSLDRTDRLSGKQMATLYSTYMQDRLFHKPEAVSERETLLEHNREDLLHLAALTPLLDYRSLFFDRHPSARFCRSKKVLHISFDLKRALPVPVTAEKNGMELSCAGSFATLTLPLIHGEMKHFFPDYRNYYYLPAEDMAIHKSVAAYVDKKHREKASARTCYIKKSGYFAPCYGACDAPCFKTSYDSPERCLELTDSFLNDKNAASEYLSQLLLQFLP